MESTIASLCFVEQETSLVLDMAGNKLPAGSLIMCKLTPFVIMGMVTLTTWEVVRWRWSTGLMMSILSSWINRSRTPYGKELGIHHKRVQGPDR